MTPLVPMSAGEFRADYAGLLEAHDRQHGKKGDAKLLYQPFELHTRWRKVSQMSLQGEAQLMLKREFNDKLKALVNYKRGELEKVLLE